MFTLSELLKYTRTAITRVGLDLEKMLIVLIMILLILPLLELNPYIYHLIILSLMFAVMAAAWVILAIAGPVSLGHATYFGIGAYFTYFAMSKWGLSSYSALMIAILVSVTVSVFFSFITFRYGIAGIYFALVTIAFAEILRQLFISFREITGGSLGVFLMVREPTPLHFLYDSKIPYYYFIIAVYIALYVITRYILNKFILVLRVIGNDELTAASMRVNILRYKMLAFSFSALICSLMGWFYIHYFRYITPDVAFGLLTSVEIVVIGLLGGLSVIGALIASLILIPLGEMLRALWGGIYAGLHVMIYGAILMTLVILRSLRIKKG